MNINLGKLPRIKKVLNSLEDRLVRAKIKPAVHLVENNSTGIIFVKPALDISAVP